MLAGFLNDFRKQKNGGSWSLFHMDHHRNIAIGLQNQLKVTVPLYPLDPMPLGNIQNWLRTHQFMHDAIAKNTGIENPDFSGIDLHNDHAVSLWLQQHLDTHRFAEQLLGIQG